MHFSGEILERQHHTKQKSLGISSIKKNLPFILSAIAVLPCISLIWNSLQLSKSIPNHSLLEVAETNSLLLSIKSHSNSLEPDGTVYLDSKNIAKEVVTMFLQETLPDDSLSTPKITRLPFPHLGIASCSVKRNSILMPNLPIDEYPNTDPYIPWIHDYHVNYPVASEVRIIAQNKRRCYTGLHMESHMKFWEPQMSLFQPVSIKEEGSADDKKAMQYRLTSMDNATYLETRFLCHFHAAISNTPTGNDSRQLIINETTLSTYFFNYEYVAWRKSSSNLPMYKLTGSDLSNFALSQLLFKCPIPSNVRDTLLSQTVRRLTDVAPIVYLDVIPIRTPPRYTKLPMTTIKMLGPLIFRSMSQDEEWLNTINAYNAYNDQVIPDIERSGRYSNLPICGHTSPVDTVLQSRTSESTLPEKQYHLVACTWTSASYNRRGDKTVIDDAASRLLEWILFHRLVGIDHIYLYDNTKITSDGNGTSPLQEICERFPEYVTYIPWRASVCNNNRPNHKNPGERSSQYAAEASCRSRFGDFTDWMTFIDTDEYLVPLMRQKRRTIATDNGNITTWHEVLREMNNKGYYILKMPSSRGRPRLNLMEESSDIANIECNTKRSATQSVQLNHNDNSCLVPKKKETYLRVYNCDYIRHPRPHRFLRAMKQIYRPDYVLSHFVHYSAVTVDMAKYYKDYLNNTDIPYPEHIELNNSHEHVLDELTEGVLIHAKTVLPHETSTRAKSCYTNSNKVCSIGYACDSTTQFDDLTHTKNLFTDVHGNFCNCWIDENIENYWIPLLTKSLERHK